MKTYAYKGKLITKNEFNYYSTQVNGMTHTFKTLGKAKDFIDRCETRGELS